MSEILVTRDGTQWGPYSPDDVNDMLRAGSLLPGDMAWMEGMSDWAPLAGLPGIHAPLVVPPSPPPVRIVRAAPTAVPVHRRTSTAAVISLMTGIIALLMLIFFFPIGIILGIVAIICGHVARADVRRSRGYLTGKGIGLTGLLAGYLAVAIPPLVMAASLYFIFGGGLEKVAKAVAERSTHAVVAAARSAHTTRLIRKEKPP